MPERNVEPPASGTMENRSSGFTISFLTDTPENKKRALSGFPCLWYRQAGGRFS